jgi:hypothetical protein
VLLPHTRRVAEQITLPWIYHSDGNLLPIRDDLTSQGMKAIHPLEAGPMDLVQLKADDGGRISGERRDPQIQVPLSKEAPLPAPLFRCGQCPTTYWSRPERGYRSQVAQTDLPYCYV